jgi:hypothetical protein
MYTNLYVRYFLAAAQIIAITAAIYNLRTWDWKGLRIFFVCCVAASIFIAYFGSSFRSYISITIFLFIVAHLEMLEYTNGFREYLENIDNNYLFFREPGVRRFFMGRLFIYLCMCFSALATFLTVDACLRIALFAYRKLFDSKIYVRRR